MSVFHLKYRPGKLSELDLTEVAERLKSFVMAKEMPQSFLFSGPKGAGKTSAARILAKTINCLDRVDGEACGKCDNCLQIEQNKSIDIIEMDAASNRGIEDVRSLKERAYLSPSKLTYKVFIIDEVHMLTKDAFNALLKLIEEPPKHTLFILCTTDAEKIPDTVLSRLTRVDFKKGTSNELKKSLNKIIVGEKLEMADEVIDFLVQKSDGSFRNLHRDFNEMVLYLGKDISLKTVMDFYSKKSGDYSDIEFEKDLVNGETGIILEKLEKMANDGADFVIFREGLLNFFQKKLLSFFNIGDGSKSVMDLKSLELWINLLIRAAKQEKETEIDQLPLELAVIDFLDKGRDGERNKISDNTKISKEETVKKKQKIAEPLEDPDKGIDFDNKDLVTVDVGGLDLDKIVESWGNILMAVKPFNHSVEAFLRAARPARVEGKTLVLEVFYPFHKDRLEEVKNRKIVEGGLCKVLGSELGFECVLSKGKKPPLIIENNTPVESVNENLTKGSKDENKADLYDIAKDIFG